MTVESATFINTLDSSKPPGTDPKGEGDDHLRLIKSVLKATFPNNTGALVHLVDGTQVNFPTGFRIRGDFSAAAQSSRALFQTSLLNGGTSIGAIPNGSGPGSNFIAWALVDALNSPYLQFSCNSTISTLNVYATGTGTPGPFNINVGGSEAFRIDVNRLTSIAGQFRINSGVSYLNGAVATYRGFWYQTNGSNRWGLGANQSAESGGNVGSDFSIDRYSDTGVWLENPFTIARSTGVASFTKRPVFAGYTPWDTQNLANPARCSTGNTLWFDWGASYASQIGVKIDTTLMGYMIHSGNIGSQSVTWANSAGSVGGVSNPASLNGATFTGAIAAINAGDSNGYQGLLGPGYLKLNRYDYGAYIDLARAASEDYKWRIHYNFNNAYLEFNFNGGGMVQFATDGNIYCKGQWFSNLSARGTQIPWAVGIGTETAAGSPGGGQTCDFGSPWVGGGLRFGASGATWVWLRGTWLING